MEQYSIFDKRNGKEAFPFLNSVSNGDLEDALLKQAFKMEESNGEILEAVTDYFCNRNEGDNFEECKIELTRKIEKLYRKYFDKSTVLPFLINH